MAIEVNYWTKRSPFFEASVAAGCGGFGVANHMLQPHSYMDPIQEYQHLVDGVTLWDVATERQVEITGPDALRFTEMLTPRDVSACPVGRGRYVVITAEDGGIINDPIMFRLAENHFWFSTSDSDLILWVQGLAVFAGMDVSICEPDVSPVQIQGPKSTVVIENLFGDDGAGLKNYEIRKLDLNGIPVMLSRTGWSGEVGYEIFLCDSQYGGTLWNQIMEAGRSVGIVVTGPSDIRRVEAGILGYGCDISTETNPYEAGLHWMMAKEKQAEFIGKKALQKIVTDGIRHQLVGIELNGDPLPQGSFSERWQVVSDGTHVGEVTVALYSPRLNKNIGYAMLDLNFTALGCAIEIETPFGRMTSTVVEKPFIKKAVAG